GQGFVGTCIAVPGAKGAPCEVVGPQKRPLFHDLGRGKELNGDGVVAPEPRARFEQAPFIFGGCKEKVSHPLEVEGGAEDLLEVVPGFETVQGKGDVHLRGELGPDAACAFPCGALAQPALLEEDDPARSSYCEMVRNAYPYD